MTTCGSAEDKLKWAFKMYDEDNSREVDYQEMENVMKVSQAEHAVRYIHAVSSSKKYKFIQSFDLKYFTHFTSKILIMYTVNF